MGEEVFDVLFCDDIMERQGMQLLKKVNYFLEDWESLILERDRVHVGRCDFLVPVLLGNIDEGILYHIYI